MVDEENWTNRMIQQTHWNVIINLLIGQYWNGIHKKGKNVNRGIMCKNVKMIDRYKFTQKF